MRGDLERIWGNNRDEGKEGYMMETCSLKGCVRSRWGEVVEGWISTMLFPGASFGVVALILMRPVTSRVTVPALLLPLRPVARFGAGRVQWL